LAGCAKILAVSPIWLPSLTSKRDECRVGKDEKRSFEESDLDLDVAPPL
jgi:hypothetical protein